MVSKELLRKYGKTLPLFKDIYYQIDAARQELDAAQEERRAARAERDAALAQRDAALAERGAALTERGVALTERDAALAERDRASSELAALQRVPIWVPPGHYYSPIVEPINARKRFDQLARSPLPESLPGLALNRAEMVSTWHKLLPFLQSNPFSAKTQPGLRYFYDNPFYTYGDGAVLHAMLRHYRPNKIIEVGSGWSSACTLDTIEKYFDNPCSITFIEPYPDRLHELMGDTSVPCTILQSGVQDIDLSVFSELDAGDLLFIDSTHILATGSDVCFELFEVLPALKPGVLIHFHDVFWPFEYPSLWAIEENRSWNELYGLLAFLMHNDAYEIVFFNDYFGQLERNLVEQTFPTFGLAYGGGLWLTKR